MKTGPGADAVSEAARERMVGAILIDAGKLRPEDAEKILRAQKEKGLRFGEAGVRLGLLKQADIDFALSRQFGYSYLQPGERGVAQELVAAYQPFSHAVEELRALRSQLMLRWFTGEPGHKALAVVGTERGEGRSYVAANLAVVFSQLDERTLLIDADLRNPRQHSLFRLENRTGLSAWLSGRAGSEAIQAVPGLPGLSVLTAGAVPPNPQELLGRAQFPALLEQICADHDVVLLDTPAMDTAADAQMVGARARAALLVARKDHSRLPVLQALSAALSDSGAAVVGAVMNAF
ncbi:MAG TPA: chain length determinant protein tyrosine kinase EpsG [Rhodocyclaceae bacterium]|nr:MAG: chain length determinant protein tyrosine kinase EpsG [Betaproteobacteria bacterium CG2_30_68_42]PJA58754.1 MAG: chain length determinant protein tyrosine kinase EpsG [Rhodocyclales bacterium CG_4_9_14_3_um_filter_68_10]HCX33925.1 chain length determinant protein tyrosine kinase EpsG [Rhodocyclaceae bacterium]